MNKPRDVYKDAVKDHGPAGRHWGMRTILLNLADWLKPDGTLWVTNKVLAAQCGLQERSLREHLQQLESGGWFDRERKPGRPYHYKLLDPGPGASIPTVAEIRQLRSRRAALPSAATVPDTPAQELCTDSAEAVPEPSQSPCRTRPKETYRDVPPNGRPLPQGASVHRRSRVVVCPVCKTDQVEGVDCTYCAQIVHRNGRPTEQLGAAGSPGKRGGGHPPAREFASTPAAGGRTAARPPSPIKAERIGE